MIMPDKIYILKDDDYIIDYFKTDRGAYLKIQDMIKQDIEFNLNYSEVGTLEYDEYSDLLEDLCNLNSNEEIQEFMKWAEYEFEVEEIILKD